MTNYIIHWVNIPIWQFMQYDLTSLHGSAVCSVPVYISGLISLSGEPMHSQTQ